MKGVPCVVLGATRLAMAWSPSAIQAPRRGCWAASEAAFEAHEVALRGAGDPASPSSREAHNARQASVFSGEAVASFAAALPPELEARLDRIVRMARTYAREDAPLRVLDVGTGTGCLATKYGGQVVGVDVSPAMLEAATKQQDVEYWCGDVVDYEQEWVGKEPFDVAVFNACFCNVFDQKASLAAAAAVVRPGGAVLATHPLGADFVDELRRRDSTVVPHSMPRSIEHVGAIAPPFLDPAELIDEPEFYAAKWTRRAYAPLERLLFVRGPVGRGYGRGSKKLGVPTANLREDLFGDALADLPSGVYCGFAKLRNDVSRAVCNVGYSPTFAGAENPVKIIEAHLCDYEGSDFYDKPLSLLLLGFLRPERKFPDFSALLAAINSDVLASKQALQTEEALVRLTPTTFNKPISSAQVGFRTHPALLNDDDDGTQSPTARWIDIEI